MEKAGMTTFEHTADASLTYREQAKAEVARAISAAPEGNWASFSANNTVVVAPTIIVPLVSPAARYMVTEWEEQGVIEFLPR